MLLIATKPPHASAAFVLSGLSAGKNEDMKLPRFVFLLLLMCILSVGTASAAGTQGEGASSGDAVLTVLMAIAILLVAAKCGAHLAAKMGQPPVLGELLFGVLIGNLTIFGLHTFDFIKTNEIISILAEIGVILLLFNVGLESKLDEMLSVGISSLVVATIGVIAPFALGWGVAHVFLPNESVYTHIFIGATLCATSVGITARVLQDLGKVHLRESKIILGAAVIDDIQGLVILAVVQGIIIAANGGSTLEAGGIAWIIAKALLFLVGAIVLGRLLAPKMFRIASAFRAQGVLLTVALVFCFVLAWIAGKIHLAPIVGAFTAGLLLEESHYDDFIAEKKQTLPDLIEPIGTFLVPIFFVLMGVRVELLSFANVEVLGFAAILTVAAIIGKQVCGLGVLEKGLDRLSVSIGMIPRGEVGLIFAAIGTHLVVAGHKVVSQNTFSSIVVMVITTTLITPPVLRWSLMRKSAVEGSEKEYDIAEVKVE
jgi:Kef-type K+ transport system membrane component KefB